MSEIHPTAIVDPSAIIGEGTVVGAYAIIERNAKTGKNCTISASSYIGRNTTLGEEVKVFPHAVIGMDPQDLKYLNEETTLEIGDRTVVREFATVNRATTATWKTTVGADCLLMAYSHVAHDCVVGNNCILANSATLAGHITLEDWVIIGGIVPIHQFVKIGCHAMIGGGWRVPKDVPPYVIAVGDPLKPVDLNKIGLKRRGFSDETIENLKKAFKILFRSETDMKRSLETLDSLGDLGPEVEHLKQFILTSERGVIM